MNCHKHHERPAIGQCVDCGKGLCTECFEKFGEPSCDACTVSLVEEGRKELFKGATITIIGFVLGYLLGAAPPDASIGSAIFIGLMFAGLPWGWMALTRITPRIFLSLSFAGWVVYFIIKASLAMMIGIFVMPFKIYQIVAGMKKSQDLKNYAIK